MTDEERISQRRKRVKDAGWPVAAFMTVLTGVSTLIAIGVVPNCGDIQTVAASKEVIGEVRAKHAEDMERAYQSIAETLRQSQEGDALIRVDVKEIKEDIRAMRSTNRQILNEVRR